MQQRQVQQQQHGARSAMSNHTCTRRAHARRQGEFVWTHTRPPSQQHATPAVVRSPLLSRSLAPAKATHAVRSVPRTAHTRTLHSQRSAAVSAPPACVLHLLTRVSVLQLATWAACGLESSPPTSTRLRQILPCISTLVHSAHSASPPPARNEHAGPACTRLARELALAANGMGHCTARQKS